MFSRHCIGSGKSVVYSPLCCRVGKVIMVEAGSRPGSFAGTALMAKNGVRLAPDSSHLEMRFTVDVSTPALPTTRTWLASDVIRFEDKLPS